MEKFALFLNFRGKFGQILIDIVILNWFGYKNNSFFDFEKVENFSENFWEILRNLMVKMANIKHQISKLSENLLIKIQ